MTGPFLNLPNSISLARIPFSAAACYFVAAREPVPACVAIFLAVISDFLDGLVARRTGSISDWGKILDPLADKIGLVAFVATLAVVGAVPVWFVVAVVLRDLLIAAGGILITLRSGTPPISNIWGKLTSLFLSFYLTSAAVTWMLDMDLWPGSLLILGLDPLGLLSLAFVAVSFFVYSSLSVNSLRNR